MAKRGRPRKTEQNQNQQMSLSTPPPVVKPVQAVEQVMEGSSADRAINLEGENDINLAVSRHLDRLFNTPKEDKQINSDGDYFIISEQIAQNLKRTKKFKVVFVEDSKGIKHQIFFLLPFTRI